MDSLTGGRLIFSSSLGSVVLGINNGIAPVFPTPQSGAFNIEVFTNTSISGLAGAPSPESGFNSGAADAGGTIDDGFLTGTNVVLGAGNFLVVDSVTGEATQGPTQITLGAGNQTVVGARFDTLVGGGSSQVLSALLGNETVIGSGSIWGGQADSIVGSGQIVVTGSQTTVAASGAAVISAAAQDTITSLPGNTGNMLVAAGPNDRIDLTGNSGAGDAVIGSVGDVIIAGSGVTNIDATAGGMAIFVGAGGTTNVTGSTNLSIGNAILGGAGNLDFNPGQVAGKGDFVDLEGSTGMATVNTFAFGTTRVASPDTIVATNNADSVFGGDGDRIGVGNGATVGGAHQWVHADTVAGSAVGFGTFDSVSGNSTAQVTVGGFSTASDFIFYNNENVLRTNAIIAASQATTVNGAASTMIALPDGTVMTLIGITQAQLTAGLFKP
jgi:hypothetical protein